jgi:hypothetical protein
MNADWQLVNRPTHPRINGTIDSFRKISLPQFATQIPVSAVKTLDFGFFVSLLEGLEKVEASGAIPRGGHPWDRPVSWLADGNIGESAILRVGHVQVVSAKVGPVPRIFRYCYDV